MVFLSVYCVHNSTSTNKRNIEGQDYIWVRHDYIRIGNNYIRVGHAFVRIVYD